MRKLLWLSVVALVACSAPGPLEDGDEHLGVARDEVVGPNVSNAVDVIPWAVRVEDANGDPYCTGTLLTPTDVLIAKHCLGTRTPTTISIPGVGTRTVTSSDSYTGTSPPRDLAILHLDEPLFPPTPADPCLAGFPLLGVGTQPPNTTFTATGYQNNGVGLGFMWQTPGVIGSVTTDSPTGILPGMYGYVTDVTEPGDSGSGIYVGRLCEPPMVIGVVWSTYGNGYASRIDDPIGNAWVLEHLSYEMSAREGYDVNGYCLSQAQWEALQPPPEVSGCVYYTYTGEEA